MNAFWIRRLWRAALLGASLVAMAGATAAAPPVARESWWSDRPGAYLLLAAGGSQYEYDCIQRSSRRYDDEDCLYSQAGAGKVGLGYRFGRIGVEGAWTDYGRARVDNGRTPRDALRVQMLGVNLVFTLPFGPVAEGLLRVGVGDVRHSRSDDTGGAQHIFTAGAGLGVILHLHPNAALEIAWDGTVGEGRNTGTTGVGALTAGLRWSF
jgi:hypothetical protein